MFLRCTAPAAELPFSLEDLKLHCRVDHDDDDSILQLYARAAIRQGEFECNRVWQNSVWEGSISTFPSGPIEIPRSPCTELISIKFVDDAQTLQTLSPDAYDFFPSSLEWDGGRPFAYVAPVSEWPAGSNVTLELRMGWPQDKFPDDLKEWIFIKVSSHYEQREDLASATRKISIEFPRHFASSLLDPYYLPR